MHDVALVFHLMHMCLHAGLALMLEEQLRAHGIGLVERARFLLFDLLVMQRELASFNCDRHAAGHTHDIIYLHECQANKNTMRARRMCERPGAAASAVPKAAKLGCHARLGHHRPARAGQEVHQEGEEAPSSCL